MTKVEELKEDTITMVRLYDHGEMIMPDVVRVLDSLISAAELQGMKKQQEQDTQYDKYEREAYEQAEKNRIAAARSEGKAEGAEEVVKKIQKAAYRCQPGEMLHINNSIPMLVLVSSVVNLEDTDFEPKHYRCTWNREPFTSCEDYRKAGGQAEHCPWFEDKDDHLLVLAPTEEKP